MAEKRMFTKKVTDDDIFTAMPPTAQCLYFHLCMGADDDGFSNNIRIAMFNAHASTDDFNTLVQKRFIIPFESGVIVITHWKLHNYIQNDRYHETKFLEEKSRLVLMQNKVYEMDTKCIQAVSKMEAEIRLDKNRLDKDRYIASVQETDLDSIKEIISYLNSKIGSQYRATSEKTKKHIRARLNEGFSVDDFKTVIDKKSTEWSNDPKMAQYLRPETLFGTKFESYLNQKVIKKPAPKNSFHNFKQRDYDMDELEKKLLGR